MKRHRKTHQILKLHDIFSHFARAVTLLELLALIKPDSLNRCMMKFVASLCPALISELEKEQEKQAAKVTHALYRYILRCGVWLNIDRVSLKIQVYIFRRFPTLLLTHSSIMTIL